MAKILIIGGNTTTHELVLSDRRHTIADKGEKVKWKIKDNTSTVQSITMIQVKGTSKDIFSGRNGKSPDKEDNRKWKGRIAEDVLYGDECEYSISWLDSAGNPHPDDPKISIYPSHHILKWVIAFLAGAIGISLFLSHKKRSIK